LESSRPLPLGILSARSTADSEAVHTSAAPHHWLTLSTAAEWATVGTLVLSLFAVYLTLYLFKRQSDDRHEERALGVTHWVLRPTQDFQGRYYPQVMVQNASSAAVYDVNVTFSLDLPDGDDYHEVLSSAVLPPGEPWQAIFPSINYPKGSDEDLQMDAAVTKIPAYSTSILRFRDSANGRWRREQDGYLFNLRAPVRERWKQWRTRRQMADTILWFDRNESTEDIRSVAPLVSRRRRLWRILTLR